MGRVSKYPDELRERAVRMVAEVRPQYPSQWAAITAVAGMLGIGTPETLRTWNWRSEVDTGQRPGCDLADGRGEQGAAQGDRGAAAGQ
jgi:transposase